MSMGFLDRLQISEYVADLDHCCDQPISWEKLANKTVLISGATGMVGTFLIDVLMRKNHTCSLDCGIVALGRSSIKAQNRFPYFEDDFFRFLEVDICAKELHIPEASNYVIHLASTTHPMAYSTDPIGTINSNIIGLSNLFDYIENQCIDEGFDRALFASSVEIYGENRGDVDKFTEEYCGYIDCNTLRAGYPEAKRLAEAMCQAHAAQYGLDVVIPRLPRTYGPTMLWEDTKAISQFIKKGVLQEDIVLKSKGDQLYSYLYVADTVSALLWCLLEGGCGEAYNAADPGSDITLLELAKCIATISNSSVVFELPNETEKAGYSSATKAVMDAEKLRLLGWRAGYGIDCGIAKTISIFNRGEKRGGA